MRIVSVCQRDPAKDAQIDAELQAAVDDQTDCASYHSPANSISRRSSSCEAGGLVVVLLLVLKKTALFADDEDDIKDVPLCTETQLTFTLPPAPDGVSYHLRYRCSLVFISVIFNSKHMQIPTCFLQFYREITTN